DGESAAHGQRVLGAEADGGGQDLPGGVALDGAVHAGKCLRAQLARGGGGQSYGGGCSVDRNRPVIAGHVPVELVVGIEIANRVRAAVVDEDGLGGIHRAGNVDLQLAVAAFAAALVLESLAGGIGYRKLKIYIPGAVDTSKTVLIHYSSPNAVRYFDSHDEFYWNVTGNDWPVPIDAASATVALPASASGQLRAQAFTGVYGSVQRDATWEVLASTVSFRAENPL